MRSLNNLFLAACAFLTSEAQMLVQTDPAGGSWATWDHNYKTNLYSITRVTPATPGRPGDYWNGIEPMANWTRRVGLAWYFDRICPCNWGCDGRFCPWCANDNRFPDWYSRSLADVEAAEPFEMLPIYDCNDDLYNGIDFEMEEVRHDWDAYEVLVTTDYVRDITGKNWETMRSVGALPDRDFIWRHQKFTLKNMNIYVDNYITNSFKMNSIYGEPIAISPSGVKYVPVWWNVSFNIKYSIGGGQNINVICEEHSILVPKGQDILAWFSLYKQQIGGTILGDIMLQSADGNPYITWKMRVPRANYEVYIRSDDNEGYNYFYPTVNEVLCGPPTNPPMCRTHDQKKGRIVNRFYGTFIGELAPYLNRTVYKWDVSLENPNDYYNSNWELRHDFDIISMDRLPFDGRNVKVYDSIPTANQVDRGEGAKRFTYNTENPMLSYKLY